MLNILYLVHRLPYPPNKGDKVRSFNILKHLASQHNIYLGTFVDDPDDEKYVPVVKKYCKEVYFEKINKSYSKLRSLLGLLKGTALTLDYYRSSSFESKINEIIGDKKIDVIFVFSSVMAQYLRDDIYPKVVVDFVDVDSQKWSDYSDKTSLPLSWLYKREGKYLLTYERHLALRVKHSFFVTEKERELFSNLAPESVYKTSALNNGVDSDFFSPNIDCASPFKKSSINSIAVVFTGAMDYWPNIDAVVWFVENVFLILVNEFKNIKFYIVGRSPSQLVLNLNSDNVIVTGTVDDVRPYLQHADVIVAPLRIARGIQNKILEAMSMGKPVVASTACVGAIDAVEGVEIYSADTALDYVGKISSIINKKPEAEFVGRAARLKVIEKYSWESHLQEIDKYLNFNVSDNIL